MTWLPLTGLTELETILLHSHQKPQLIFKHSTRCSVSFIAKNRLDRGGELPGVDCHYIDLITYREVSNAIAEKLQVVHQSPQVLLIHKGECVFEETHNAIDFEEIADQVARLQ